MKEYSGLSIVVDSSASEDKDSNNSSGNKYDFGNRPNSIELRKYLGSEEIEDHLHEIHPNASPNELQNMRVQMFKRKHPGLFDEEPRYQTHPKKTNPFSQS